MGSGRSRAIRGLIAAAACTLLAYWGHADAGGARPSASVLIALAVPLTALTILLAGSRRGPVSIFALVGGSQLALHLLLQLLGGESGGESGGSAGRLLGALPTGIPPVSGMSGISGMPGGQVMSGMNPLLMSGAHLLATVITAAVLSGAEQAALACAFALVETLLPTRTLSAPAPPQPPQTVRASSVPRNLRLRGVLTRRLNLRRGPPAAVAA
jgi:hypothetical protein